MEHDESHVPGDIASYRRISGWRRTRFDQLERSGGGPLAWAQVVAGVVFLAVIVLIVVSVVA